MNIISNLQFQISNSLQWCYQFRGGVKHKLILFTVLRANWLGNWKLEIGNSPQGGFTLMELIIVIGIMGVFATGIIATLNPYEQYKKAQDAKRKSELNQLQKAVEAYYQDTGRYPASSSNHMIQVTDEITSLPKEISWGGSWQPYMNVVPKDPGGYSYAYISAGTGQSYYIYASLDRGTKDPDICAGLINGECSSLNGQSNICGNNPCNYGVSSPNVTP